jgi:hypothetical protein
MTQIVATSFPQSHLGLARVQVGWHNLQAWGRWALDGLIAARQRRVERVLQAHFERIASADPRVLAEWRAIQTRQEA